MIETQNYKKNVLESVENNFSLVPLSFSYNLCNLWLFLCRVFCNWMLDHDKSSLVSSVVFGADMWTTIGHLSYIHNAYISLHVTHIIIITNMYIVIF